MIVLGDASYVWGLVDKDKPLLRIPSGVLNWKLRCRARRFAFIYLRFDYGVEKRAIIACNDHYEVADWVQELNITGKTT